MNRIYEENEISTDLTKSEMKEPLNLCTKNVHFTFEGNTYVQNDGVAKSSIGTKFSKHIYGRIGAFSNTNSIGQDEVLDKVC